GNGGQLHGRGQLRDGCAGGGGRAGGNGRRHGACAGQVQAHHAAARHRSGRHDRPIRIGEQTGRGGSDGERGGRAAAVVGDGQGDRLIDRSLVRNLDVELSGRDVVERGVYGADLHADSGRLNRQRHAGRDPDCVREVRPEDGEHHPRSVSLAEGGAVGQAGDGWRTGRGHRDRDGDRRGGDIQSGVASVLGQDAVVADLELRGGDRDAGGGGRPRAAERRDADLLAARGERDGSGGGGAAGGGYGCGDGDGTGGRHRRRRRL